MSQYRISELAGRTGTPPTTLRYYDKEGLLPAVRSHAGYRLYGEEAVERLRFIASGKQFGLPLAEIRALLTVWEESPCADVRRHLRPLLAAKLTQADQRAAALALFAGRLRQALADVDGPPHPGRCAAGCGCLSHQPGQSDQAPASPQLAGRPQPPRPEDAPIACTLTGPEQVSRAGQWQRLLARARRRVPIEGGVRIHLPAGAAGPAAELAAAEQSCCAFFGFTLRLAGPELLLEVTAPAEAAPLLAGLFGVSGPGAVTESQPTEAGGCCQQGSSS